MRKRQILTIAGSLLALTAATTAAEQTVTLSVDEMTCQTCPYQVESALKGVEGVLAVNAELETREAVVTFDDAVTDVAILTEATTNAGYPSELKVQTP